MTRSRARYFLSLSGLAVVVALTTIRVQHSRAARSREQLIDKEVGITKFDVKDPAQIRQIAAISIQLERGERVSATQISQLAAILNGPLDFITQGGALAILTDMAKANTLPAQQKTKVADAALNSIKSSDIIVRRGSVMLLGRLKEQRAIPAILPLLNDPEEGVRSSAKKALRRIQNLPPVSKP